MIDLATRRPTFTVGLVLLGGFALGYAYRALKCGCE